jgi:hypothetical protein
MNVPTIAVFLLQRFCRDEALVGDILEEFDHRQSRAWLWRQVAVVVLLGLPYGLMKEPPKRGRMPMPIGGIGLLAATGLVTIVAPGAWWVGAIAVGGGALIGAVMIRSSRRRVLKGGGRRNILLPLVLAAAVGDAAAQPQPKAAVPIDPVEGIVEAFKTHQVVMLPGGHGSKQFHDLLLAVVRDPRMPGTLTDIVVEFGSSRYQDLIDRFVRGDAMPDRTIRHAWQNTVIAGMGNDGPYVEEFYRAMRELNAPLPVQKRYRVLGGDPPIDWDNVTTRADVRKWSVRRDTFPADLIRREVVERGRRALVVYGQQHFPRKEVMANYDTSNWQAQTMTSLLEASGVKPFVILSDAGQETVGLQNDIATWPVPSLALVRGTVMGVADFTTFVGADGDRFAVRGADDFVKIPRDQHKPMRMEDQVDAILWMGVTRPPTPALLSKGTCADPEYLPMRLRRIALAGLPPGEADAARRACGGRPLK